MQIAMSAERVRETANDSDVVEVDLEGSIPLDFRQSNISFTFKRHNPQKTLHCCEKTPAEIKHDVTRSPRTKQVVKEVAESSGNDVESVEQEAQALLEEIGHKMALPAIRILAFFLRSVLRRVLKAINVNIDGLELLSSTAREWPVVLLPSHRSYLDFILVTYIMFEHNMTLPCIAAGQDFMSMQGISPLLRRSGAFFLRRTFGSDKLYRTVFSEYVKAVLCSGDCPMEFFVEGTRSRTGKSLHPRLGLLSMVIEPYLEGRLPDIMMVPISISYERTMEEYLFSRELLGVPKPKESTTALAKAYTLLAEDYGSIYVHIGKPISLHEVCQRHGISRVPHSLLPREASVLLPEEWKVVKELGHIIVDQTHYGMKIFPTALVATILLQYPNGLKLDELTDQVKWLKAQILLRGGHISWRQENDSRKVVLSGLKMLSTIVKFSSDNVEPNTPNFIPSPEPLASTVDKLLPIKIDPREFKLITDRTLIHLHLGYYRNQMFHLFVEDAMIAFSLDQEISYDAALKRYSTLYSALACEFVLPLNEPLKLFGEGIKRSVNRGLFSYISGENILCVQASQYRQFYFLQNLLRPFVDGVWVVCCYLLSLGDGVQTLTAAIKGAQMLSIKCLKYGILKSFEIVSLGVIKNALSSLHLAGLILQASNEFGTGRDRLVKVIERGKLLHFTDVLGAAVLPCTKCSKL